MVSWFRIALLVLFVIHDTIKRERRATCKLAAMPNGTCHQARPKAVMKKTVTQSPKYLKIDAHPTSSQSRPVCDTRLGEHPGNNQTHVG